MGTVFIDIVDHRIEILKGSNAAAGGNKRQVLGGVVLLVLVGNTQFPTTFTAFLDLVYADLNVVMGLSKKNKLALGK